MFLVIDTETNGLMDYKRPADAQGQPRVAEFAGILLDGAGNIQSEYQRYIKPPMIPADSSAVGESLAIPEWTMSPATTDVNGITDEMLQEKGFYIHEVLQWYSERILEGRAIVAFGAQFDCKMMRAELRRAGMDDLFERTPNICLMRSARPFAKSIGRELTKAGGSQKGWPKLSDLCNFFGIKTTEQHGALVDAKAAALCFAAMLKAGFEAKPEVHHAKDYEEIKNNV